MSNASFLERLTEKNFKVACLSSFLYWTGPRPSELLLNACFSESRVTLSVNAGEALMKSQIGWISISRCIDTKFGTKVKRNVTNALDKSKSSLSNKKNDKVSMNDPTAIFGTLLVQKASKMTYELDHFSDFP